MKRAALITAKRKPGQSIIRTGYLILLSLTCVCLSLSRTRAQGVHLGVKAGANLFKVDGESFDKGFQFGYNLGAFAELNVTRHWGIQPELLFNQTNYRTGDNFNEVFPQGVNDVKGNLDYLSIPVLLSFRPISLISFQAGPQFGILLNNNMNLVQNGQTAFKKGDFSLVGGAQLNLAALKLGARYVIGLTDVRDLQNGTAANPQTWRNEGFQIYAGFRIF